MHACLTTAPGPTLTACLSQGQAGNSVWAALLTAAGLAPGRTFMDQCMSLQTITQADGRLHYTMQRDPSCAVLEPWLRLQDLSLELLYCVFFAREAVGGGEAALPEVGLLVSLLEALQREEDDARPSWDLTLTRACAWLMAVIHKVVEKDGEHEGGRRVFQEHGRRLFGVLCRLLSRHTAMLPQPTDPTDLETPLTLQRLSITPPRPVPSRPLWWPAHHGLLSLLSLLTRLTARGSTLSDLPLLDACLAPWLPTASPPPPTTSTSSALQACLDSPPPSNGLSCLLRHVDSACCGALVVSILTRFLHLTALLPSPSLTKPAPPPLPYQHYLREVCLRARALNDDRGEVLLAPLVALLRGLCVLLREPAFAHRRAYHQRALRACNIFHLMGEVLECVVRYMESGGGSDEAVVEGGRAVVRQGIALLTALVAGGEADATQAFVEAFITRQSQLTPQDAAAETVDSGLRGCRLSQVGHYIHAASSPACPGPDT